MIGNGGLVLQFAALAIRYTLDIQKQLVIGPARSGILDRNLTIDSVELAGEGERNPLHHHRASVALDRNIAVKICNAPSSGRGDAGEETKGNREKGNLLPGLQITKLPDSEIK